MCLYPKITQETDEKLKRYAELKAKRVTDVDAAKELGVTARTLRNWRTGGYANYYNCYLKQAKHGVYAEQILSIVESIDKNETIVRAPKTSRLDYDMNRFSVEHPTIPYKDEVVTIRCHECGLRFPIKLCDWEGRNFCISCNKKTYTKGEQAIKNVLELSNLEFVPEAHFGLVFSNDRHARADFYVPSLDAFIEYDGEQHYKPLSHLGGEKGLLYRQNVDSVKTKVIKDIGSSLLRIPYWDYDRIPELVTQFINELQPKGDDELDGE